MVAYVPQSGCAVFVLGVLRTWQGLVFDADRWWTPLFVICICHHLCVWPCECFPWVQARSEKNLLGNLAITVGDCFWFLCFWCDPQLQAKNARHGWSFCRGHAQQLTVDDLLGRRLASCHVACQVFQCSGGSRRICHSLSWRHTICHQQRPGATVAIQRREVRKGVQRASIQSCGQVRVSLEWFAFAKRFLNDYSICYGRLGWGSASHAPGPKLGGRMATRCLAQRQGVPICHAEPPGALFFMVFVEQFWHGFSIGGKILFDPRAHATISQNIDISYRTRFLFCSVVPGGSLAGASGALDHRVGQEHLGASGFGERLCPESFIGWEPVGVSGGTCWESSAQPDLQRSEWGPFERRWRWHGTRRDRGRRESSHRTFVFLCGLFPAAIALAGFALKVVFSVNRLLHMFSFVVKLIFDTCCRTQAAWKDGGRAQAFRTKQTPSCPNLLALRQGRADERCTKGAGGQNRQGPATCGQAKNQARCEARGSGGGKVRREAFWAKWPCGCGHSRVPGGVCWNVLIANSGGAEVVGLHEGPPALGGKGGGDDLTFGLLVRMEQHERFPENARNEALEGYLTALKGDAAAGSVRRVDNTATGVRPEL